MEPKGDIPSSGGPEAELATLHHSGQRAQHTTDRAIPAPDDGFDGGSRVGGLRLLTYRPGVRLTVSAPCFGRRMETVDMFVVVVVVVVVVYPCHKCAELLELKSGGGGGGGGRNSSVGNMLGSLSCLTQRRGFGSPRSLR